MTVADQAQNLIRQGDDCQRDHRRQAALEYYAQAAALAPDHAEAHWKLGNAQLLSGRHAAAADCYRRVLSLRPDYAEAHHNLGVALQNLGDLTAALAHLRQAIALKPGYANAYNSLGVLYRKLGRADDEIQCYRQAVAINPDHAEARNNLGNALRNQKRWPEALQAYREAARLKPDFAEAHYNLGAALLELGRHTEAQPSLQAAAALRPEHAPSQRGLGLVRLYGGQARTALAYFSRAAELQADDAETYFYLGLAYKTLHRYQKALDCFTHAAALKPDYATAINNRGLALFQLGDADAAIHCFRQAIAIDPGQAGFHYNLGNTLQHENRHAAALQSFDHTLRLQPDYPFLDGQRLFSKMQICAWDGIAEEFRQLLQKVAQRETASGPYPLFAIQDHPRLQQTAAELWVKRHYAVHSDERHHPVHSDERHHAIHSEERHHAIQSGKRHHPVHSDERHSLLTARQRHDKIRIGYFSADFHAHPVTFSCIRMLELHDKNRFEIFAFSSTPPGLCDGNTQRVADSADCFIDAHALSDAELAQLARDRKIDIAVDLGGHTGDNRGGVFARRAAPIQVNYLGYPGSSGAHYMDYIIADAAVIPDHCRAYYHEQAAYLPHSFMVNDDTRPIADVRFTRAEFDLPESGFVFCSFNNSFKITPIMFGVWMNILKAVPRAVLWLAQPQPEAAQNLRRQAGLRGVDPARLLFARRMPGMDQHLARLRLADLFLDTFPYNAHAGAGDALWAGLPLLTLQGQSFASRVAASQLQALGLPELIAGNAAEYQSRAVRLANQPRQLEKLRAKLRRNLNHAPLFDTLLYTQHLEAAYTQMQRLQENGLPPQTFTVIPL